MENKSSNERVERIMGSLDGMHKAAAPDFFYTRLKGNMQPATDKKTFFMLRPAFITAALSIFLIINVVSLLQINKAPKQDPSTRSENAAGIESFAKAYDMNSGSVYE